MANTPEHHTLVQLTTVLAAAFQDELTNLSNGCMAVGLISPNNAAGLMNQHINPDVRVSQLLQFIRNSVLVDPSNFQAFVNVLLKHTVQYKRILKSLDDKYKALGGTNETGISAALDKLNPQSRSHVAPSQHNQAPSEQVLTDKDITTLLKLIHNYSSKWNDIGLELGFTTAELNQISTNPSLFTTAPGSYLKTLLGQWVQWPTENHPSKPTLQAFCKALRGPLVGLGALANDVQQQMASSTTGTSQVHSNVVQSRDMASPQSPERSVMDDRMERQELRRRKDFSESSESQDEMSSSVKTPRKLPGKKRSDPNPKRLDGGCTPSIVAAAAALAILCCVAVVVYNPINQAAKGTTASTDDHITDVNPLFTAVKDIGDWRNLCSYLGVGDDVMNPLIHSSAPLNQKKRDCLEAYVKGGKASWRKVINVVANFPIGDKLLAKKIADDHGVDWNDEL